MNTLVNSRNIAINVASTVKVTVTPTTALGGAWPELMLIDYRCSSKNITETKLKKDSVVVCKEQGRQDIQVNNHLDCSRVEGRGYFAVPIDRIQYFAHESRLTRSVLDTRIVRTSY